MRTHDNGKTWTRITNGIPDGHFVAVVRSDPVRKGLLYAGTDAGVYVSFDDGDAWQPLQHNLPVAWVRDLLVHDNDLIAATQGRAIWVLDDLTPLRQLTAETTTADAHLFAPAAAYHVRDSQNKDTPPPKDTALGTNSPTGAIIDYTLAKPAKQVTIEIREQRRERQSHPPLRERRHHAAAARRTLLRRSLDETRRETVNGCRRAPLRLEPALPAPESDPIQLLDRRRLGRRHANRARRRARSSPANTTSCSPSMAANSISRCTIKPDPRVHATQTDMEQAFAFYQQVETELARVWQGYGEVDAVHRQLDALKKKGGAAAEAPLQKSIEAYEKKLEPLREGKGEAAPNLGAIGDALASLATDVEGADHPPTKPQEEVLTEYRTPPHSRARSVEDIARHRSSGAQQAATAGGAGGNPCAETR